MDRILPHDLEAEQQLLGAILVDTEAYHRVSGLLKAEHFYDESHGQLYAGAAAMIAAGKNANAVTLGKLPGQNFNDLRTWAKETLDTRYALDFAQLIFDLFTRRELVRIAEELIVKAGDADIRSSPSQMIENAEQSLLVLAASGRGGDRLTNLAAATTGAIDMVASAYQRDDRMAGLPTHFADLDEKMGGLAPTDLIILAGRPSMGKTALATSIAYRAVQAHQAGKGGCPVGFFSVEMSAQQLAMRLLAEASGVPSFRLRSGNIDPCEFDELLRVAELNFNNVHLRIDQTGKLSIDQLCARARRMKRQFDVGLIVVDYLQLLSGGKRSNDSRHVEVAEITTGLKALAKDLGIPVLALSQLSREVEKRPNKRPQLSDLRESGSIEQDADVVIFVFREEYYHAQIEPKAGEAGRLEWVEAHDKIKGKAELIIAKQRHGPTCAVDVQFDASLTKFSNLAKQYQMGEAA